MTSTNTGFGSFISLLTQIQNATPSPPPEVAVSRKCRALKKIGNSHIGDQCSRNKVVDYSIPQALKTTEQLVADELCTQHKTIKGRFMTSIRRQLNLNDEPTPAPTITINNLQPATNFQPATNLQQASTQQRASSEPPASSQPQVNSQQPVSNPLQPYSNVRRVSNVQPYNSQQQPAANDQISAAAHAFANLGFMSASANEPILPTPAPASAPPPASTRPRSNVTPNNNSAIKQCIGLILAQSTAIVRGGESQPYDRISRKAAAICLLASEVDKFLDLISPPQNTQAEASEEAAAATTNNGQPSYPTLSDEEQGDDEWYDEVE
ncbi:MAG: hypothetical protein Q9170_002200 [Blastenia crenularia]